MPIRMRIALAILFWTTKASPVKAMIAQVVSPTREPNCTNSAGINPRAAPRRTVSAVTTPGGAQKAIARKNDEMKSDICFLEDRPRCFSVCHFLFCRCEEGRARRHLHRTAFGAVQVSNLLIKDEIASPYRARNDIHSLAIKIQCKFVRGWAQANSIDFMNSLVLDVFFQKVCGEHTTLQQEFVISFERVQY